MRKYIFLSLCMGLLLTGCGTDKVKNNGYPYHDLPIVADNQENAKSNSKTDSKPIANNTESRNYTTLSLDDFAIVGYIDDYFEQKVDEASQDSDDGATAAVIDSKKTDINTSFGDMNTSPSDTLSSIQNQPGSLDISVDTPQSNDKTREQLLDNEEFIIRGQISDLFPDCADIPFISAFKVGTSDNLDKEEINRLCDAFGMPDGYIIHPDSNDSYICLVWEKGNYDVTIPLYMKMAEGIQRYGNVAKSYSAIIPKKYFSEMLREGDGYLGLFKQQYYSSN